MSHVKTLIAALAASALLLAAPAAYAFPLQSVVTLAAAAKQAVRIANTAPSLRSVAVARATPPAPERARAETTADTSVDKAFAEFASLKSAIESMPSLSLSLDTEAAPVLAEAVVSGSELESMIGAAGSPIDLITEQTLTAVNRNNTINANEVGSGQVRLDAGAFEGFSGIANFTINTGHNNNLQSNLNVSIVIAQ